MEEEKMDSLKKLFKTVFYLVKAERPFRNFPGLLELQDASFGESMGKHYGSDKQAKTFMHFIAEDKLDELTQLIDQNDFLGVISDGSTDTAIIEEEIVLVRVLDSHYTPVTLFLSLEPVQKANAAGLLQCVIKALENKGNCTDWRNKLVAFAADAASVNFGCREGLVTKLRREIPHLIGIQCCAHKFELALKDARESKVWETTDTFLTSLYKFYHYSSFNMAGLNEAGKAFRITILRPGNVTGTRRAPHRHRALIAVCRDWPALVNHLSQVALGTNDTAAKVKGLHQSLKSFQFVLMIQVSVKNFSICKTISEVFQDNNACVETVRNTLKAAKTMLDVDRFDARGQLIKFAEKELIESEAGDEVTYKGVVLGLRHQPGYSRRRQVADDMTLEKFIDDVVATINQMLIATEKAVGKRFESFESPVLKAIRIFEPSLLPDDEASTADYGAESIQTLTEHFDGLLDRQGFDVNAIDMEWKALLLSCGNMKSLAIKQAAASKSDTLVEGSSKYLSFWRKVLETHSDREQFKNILALVRIMLVIPIHSSEAECGFSLMGRIKSDWRSRLTPTTTSELMTIKLDKTTLKDFDPVPALNRWWMATKRGRQLTEQFGPRKLKDNPDESENKVDSEQEDYDQVLTLSPQSDYLD